MPGASRPDGSAAPADAGRPATTSRLTRAVAAQRAIRAGCVWCKTCLPMIELSDHGSGFPSNLMGGRRDVGRVVTAALPSECVDLAGRLHTRFRRPAPGVAPNV